MWWLILICFSRTLIEASKYHQNDYTIELTRVQVVDYNRSYITSFNCSLVYYNRTFRALNASAHLIKKLSMNIKVPNNNLSFVLFCQLEFQVLKFLSNEYRYFPITLEIDGCKELQRDTFGVQKSYQKSLNFDFHCPFPTGTARMTYGKINFADFPPYIPPGEYKAEGKVYDNSNFVFRMDYYGKVEEVKQKWG